MVVLGIDGALSTTGFSVVTGTKQTPILLWQSKFKTSTKDGNDQIRIHNICSEMLTIASQFALDKIVIEDGFTHTNLRTGLQLAKLRGALAESAIDLAAQILMKEPSKIRTDIGGKGIQVKKEDVYLIMASLFQGQPLFDRIGPYSDKQNKQKTSDVYDAISIAYSELE